MGWTIHVVTVVANITELHREVAIFRSKQSTHGLWGIWWIGAKKFIVLVR